jgi:hypothetical protein
MWCGVVSRYPKFLLAVELFGYTAMLPYAWMMLRYTKVPAAEGAAAAAAGAHEDLVAPLSTAAAAASGGGGGRIPYVVHVLVPCYTVGLGFRSWGLGFRV